MIVPQMAIFVRMSKVSEVVVGSVGLARARCFLARVIEIGHEGLRWWLCGVMLWLTVALGWEFVAFVRVVCSEVLLNYCIFGSKQVWNGFCPVFREGWNF